jgi:hypothetical protein
VVKYTTLLGSKCELRIVSETVQKTMLEYFHNSE